MSWTGLLALIGTAVGAVGDIKKAKADAKANDREAALVRSEAPLMRREAGFLREDAELVRESARPLYSSANSDEYNAQLAEQEAVSTEEQYAELERVQRVAGVKALGTIHAQAAAGGFTAGGSALDVLRESAINAELDALTVRHQGLLKARALREEASLLRYRAENTRADAGTVERRADLAGRRADLVEDQSSGIEARADAIQSRSKDIRKLGIYNAVSRSLNSASGFGGGKPLRQVTAGGARRPTTRYNRGWFKGRGD